MKKEIEFTGKVGYITLKDKKGNKYHYRTWFQNFLNEDIGKLFPVKRHTLIKINGKKVK